MSAPTDPRLSVLLQQLHAIAAGEKGVRVETSGRMDAMDDVIAAVNVLAEQFEEREQLRLEMQNRLQQVERLAVVGEFTASLAHELRAPLQGILSSAELIQMHQQEPIIAALAGTIEREVFRANRLIDNSRALTRRPLQLEAVSLDHVFTELRHFTRSHLASRGVHLQVADLTPLPAVRIDVDQFRQVALNLVANAADSVVERYGCEPHHNRRIEVEGRAENGVVTVDMRDYGAGIPDDHKASVFKPFYTTKTDGLGIGLSISKKLVEDQGGKLHFNSGVDGTTFHIELPPAVRDSPPSEA